MNTPDFLKLGYFPESTPPNFSAEMFGEYCKKKYFQQYHSKSNYITPKGSKGGRVKLARYNASKRGRSRREFAVPNPISYHDTALFLTKYWAKITSYFDEAKNSFSIPAVDGDVRAISITKHSDMPAIKLLKLGGLKFVLQTDISRFYHTIYTHSLPWAFHGKPASKSDTNADSKSVFFNKIDEIIRNGQDGQTIGIPVGTDSSRVLAEIISIAIDKEFSKRNPKINFIRHVDDIWFGAKSEDEAEQILSSYRLCLRQFELDINDLKTNIKPFSKLGSDVWPHRLKGYIENIKNKKNDDRKIEAFIQYYSYAFSEANSQQDEGIIKYAIKLLDTNEIWNEASLWPLLERFLASCVLNFPHSIDYVAQVIAWRNIIGDKIDFPLWKQVFNDVILEHSPRLGDHEVAWSLWSLREINQKLLSKPLEAVLQYSGDLPLVLAYHLIAEKQTTGNIDHQGIILARIETKSSLSENWLFLHEASLNKWLGKKHKFNTDHSFLKAMREKKISFFKKNAMPLVFQESESDDIEIDETPMWPTSALPKKNTGYDDIDEILDEFDDLTDF